ncbi:MAG: TIGR02147 family protein [Fibrobacteria bacterium]
MDIYQYEDFRKFLEDSFEKKREDQAASEGKYTHRKLAAEAGFTNPGYFNDVVKGRRTLSDTAMEKLIGVFGLKSNEADYFRLLVAYGQSKDPEDRQELYRQMLFRRNRSAFVRLNPVNSKYYQDYHYPLVRSAIQVLDFRGDYEELARFIRPAVPLATLKKCVRDLCEWGLLTQDPQGRYQPAFKNQEPAPSMGDLIKRLNREWVMQAADALFTFPKEERYIYSALLTVGAKTFQDIQQRIEKFREEIIALAKGEENPDRVMQFNIQHFPRSHVKEPK